MTDYRALSREQLIDRIHELQRQVEALSPAADRLSLLMENSSDYIMIADGDGKPVLFNKAYADIMKKTINLDMKPGIKPHKLTEDPQVVAFWDDLHQRVLGGEQFSEEFAYEVPGSGKRYFVFSFYPIRQNGKVVGFSEISKDITEQKRIQEELLRAQRLDSLGILAGGIAHDFNNLLGGVFGFIDLAREDLGPENQARDYLEQAMDAHSLARGLTSQLLTFARGGAPVKRVVSIEPILRSATQLALSGSNISSRFDINGHLDPVEVDEGQLSQVINNIVINARQAMPDGGAVIIRAENRTLKRNEVANLDPGDYVDITITDQGPGIPDKFLEKIFDPFFTTKQQGSGLGLATSYSIVNRHDGHLMAASVPEKGTAFTILLPTVARTKDMDETHGFCPPKNPARVLLMDDEPVMLKVGTQMLERVGCRVITAIDGADAIEQYKRAMKNENPFDVVILDLTVPEGMDGEKAASELRKTDPAVRAIASSGYTDSPVLANYQDHGFCGILTKPYCLQDIRETLHTVLNRP